MELEKAIQILRNEVKRKIIGYWKVNDGYVFRVKESLLKLEVVCWKVNIKGQIIPSNPMRDPEIIENEMTKIL